MQVESLIGNAGFGTPRDETAIVALKFENGATAEICSSVLFDAPKRMEIFGSTGYAHCTNTLGLDGAGTIETHDGPLIFDAANPYVGEIEDFARAVTSGSSPEVDGEEGLANIDILLRAVERVTE